MGMEAMNGRLFLSQLPENILRDTELWIHTDRNQPGLSSISLVLEIKK